MYSNIISEFTCMCKIYWVYHSGTQYSDTTGNLFYLGKCLKVVWDGPSHSVYHCEKICVKTLGNWFVTHPHRSGKCEIKTQLVITITGVHRSSRLTVISLQNQQVVIAVSRNSLLIWKGFKAIIIVPFMSALLKTFICQNTFESSVMHQSRSSYISQLRIHIGDIIGVPLPHLIALLS